MCPELPAKVRLQLLVPGTRGKPHLLPQPHTEVSVSCDLATLTCILSQAEELVSALVSVVVGVWVAVGCVGWAWGRTEWGRRGMGMGKEEE